MALTGRSGVPVVKASTSKLFQAKTRSAGVSSASPQSRSTVGPFPPAVNLDARKQASHRRRQRRAPFRYLDRAARIGDASERMRKDDAGIGEEAAPVAGMMGALAQIDDEVDRVAAARPEKQRRPVGRNPRAVRGDQQIRAQEFMLVL